MGLAPRLVRATLALLSLAAAPAARACGGGFGFLGAFGTRTEPLSLLGLPIGTVRHGFLSETWSLDPPVVLLVTLVALGAAAVAHRSAAAVRPATPLDEPVIRRHFLAAFGLALLPALVAHLASHDGQVVVSIFTTANLGVPGTAAWYAAWATLPFALVAASVRGLTRLAGPVRPGPCTRAFAFAARRPWALPLALMVVAGLLAIGHGGPGPAGSWLQG